MVEKARVPRYTKPPLVEALCEVYAQDAPGWSDSSAQRLEERFRNAFSGEAETLELRGVEFELGTELEARQRAISSVRRRLWTMNGDRMIQFEAGMCAYNVLGQYSTFEAYAADIKDFVAGYLAEARPTALRWTGQRYINKVVLPRDEANPSMYFTIYPSLPASTTHRPFALQVVMEQFQGGQVVLNLTYRSQEAEGEVYLLEIYARTVEKIEPEATRILDWQRAAHTAVRSVFETAITNRARQLLGVLE